MSEPRLFNEIDSSASPVMAQYLAMKREHKDALLFFHMGDFYELFFEDALTAAEVLNIALTRRGRYQEKDIPMCGVPLQASQAYLAKLVRAGFKVVIADQTETSDEARARGAKGPMKRTVTRIVTSGTLTQDDLLEAREHNHLAAIGKDGYAVAWMELSTGSFWFEEFSPSLKGRALLSALESSLMRIAPSELLLPMSWMEQDDWMAITHAWGEHVAPLSDVRFAFKTCERHLKSFLRRKNLESLGSLSEAAVCASGVIASYVEETLCGSMPPFENLRRYEQSIYMQLDGITMRHLELFHTMSGDKKGSLLSALDHSVCAMGARLLSTNIAAPLRDCAAIEERLERIAWFLEQDTALKKIRAFLEKCPDMERAVTRLALGRGSPLDAGMVRQGLSVRRALIEQLRALQAPASMQELMPVSAELDELHDLLHRALVDTPPLSLRMGGIIKKGYDSRLDDTIEQYADHRRHLQKLEARYAQETAITGLKIRYNALIGYFIEVKASHAAAMRARSDVFTHRQSLATSVRFISEELVTLERALTNHEERREALESELFEELRKTIAAKLNEILASCQAIAWIDVASSGASYARMHKAVRPHLDDSYNLVIKGGRHPVVEQMPLEEGGFIPNDCHLSEHDRMWLLTGPNMAGKSTFLRQNALIILMAQAGFYVPCEQAHIGIVDRLCSRVGASDDLVRGRSTFMVEMIETAAILNQASHKSFVILDEIGRGTATYDGLAIAWAVLEYLHDVNGARTIVATHYHELTQIAARLPSLSLHRMALKEWDGKVILMRAVEDGAATGSYGIHVAAEAGLPDEVVTRAHDLMDEMTQQQITIKATKAKKKKAHKIHPALVKLKELNLDDMTPRAALETLYQLKKDSDG